MKKILGIAFLNALGTTVYVTAVGSFLFYGTRSFPGPDTVFIPIAMLLLLVLSAGITGGLVVGRPIMWYINGKKHEAVGLLMYTLAFLCGITLIAFSALFWSFRILL